jgi:hypothetical protein
VNPAVGGNRVRTYRLLHHGKYCDQPIRDKARCRDAGVQFAGILYGGATSYQESYKPGRRVRAQVMLRTSTEIEEYC